MPGTLKIMKKTELKQSKIGFPLLQRKKVVPTFVRSNTKESSSTTKQDLQTNSNSSINENSSKISISKNSEDLTLKQPATKDGMKKINYENESVNFTQKSETHNCKLISDSDANCIDLTSSKHNGKLPLFLQSDNKNETGKTLKLKENVQNGTTDQLIRASMLHTLENSTTNTSDDENEDIPLAKVIKLLKPAAEMKNVETKVEKNNSLPKTSFLHTIKHYNGPMPSTVKSLTTVTPGSIVKPVIANPPTAAKSIVIAIDMEPEKWKQLSQKEQIKIIEEKKKIARHHLLNFNTLKSTLPTQSPLNHQKVILRPSSINLRSPINILPNFKTITAANVVSKSGVFIRSPVLSSHVQSISVNHQLSQMYSPKVDESSLNNLLALPVAKAIPMPNGFPNKSFGDVAMIVEFVNAFKKLLKSDNNPDIFAMDVMKGLMDNDSEYVSLISNILLQFLKVLLGNEDYKIIGLKMELADLPLTEYTVSYLSQQFIKSQLDKKKKLQKAEELSNQFIDDYDNEEKIFLSGDDDNDDDYYDEYNKKKKKSRKREYFAIGTVEHKLNRIGKLLDSMEFHTLTFSDQLTVLSYMLNLVLDSQDVLDFYYEVETEKSEAYRNLEKCRIERLKFQKELQERRIKENMVSSTSPTTIESITSKKEESKEDNDSISNETKPIGKFNGMTQRQMEATRVEAGKEIQRKKDIEKEETEERKKNEDACTERLQKLQELSKRIMGIQPLGSDRFYRHYFLFPSGTPGLFVHSCNDMTKFCHPDSHGRWDFFDDILEVNKLIANLSLRGIKENHLRQVLKSNYNKIAANLKEMSKWKSNIGDNANIHKPLTAATSTSTVASRASAVHDKQTVTKTETGAKTDIRPSDNDSSRKSDGLEATKVINNVIIISKTCAISKNADSNVNSDNNLSTNCELVKQTSRVNVELARDSSTKVIPDESALNEKNQKTIEQEELPITEKVLRSMQDRSLEALKLDIIESAERIVHGSLGELQNLEDWICRLKKVESFDMIKDFILQMQSCIYSKFLGMPFDPLIMDISVEWCKAVTKSSTLSKLHMLFGILENSILWERSAEKVRCKVCRKMKGCYESDHLMLCDECNNGYHMHCIRPPVMELPTDKWTCPKCLPQTGGKGKREQTCSNEKASDQSAGTPVEPVADTDNEDSGHEDLCHVCESDGFMILCDTCPLSFHLACHVPPLRRAPRGNWSCFECRNPRKNQKYTKRPGNHPSVRNNSTDSDTDDDKPGGEDLKDKSSKNSKKKRKPGVKAKKRYECSKGHCSDTESDFSSKQKTKKVRKLKNDERVDCDDEFHVKKMGDTKKRVEKAAKIKIDAEKEKLTSSSTESSKRQADTNIDSLKDSSWEENHTSLSLGNKRPKYSKDSSPTYLKPTKDDKTTHRKAGRQRGRTSNEVRTCRTIIISLQRHKDAVPFLHPVNANQVPGYFDVVKEPMDFSTILTKLDGFVYEDILQIMNDINLVFKNADLYFEEDDPTRKAGKRLHNYFDLQLKKHLPEVYSMLQT